MKKFVSVIMSLLIVCCLFVPAFAESDNFRPSVEQKGTPDIIKATLDEITYDAILFTDSEQIGINTTDTDPVSGEMIVTPYSRIKSAPQNVNSLVDIAAVENAYDEIMRADSFNDIISSVPNTYIVRDFFDITLKGNAANKFASGAKLKVVFDIGTAADVVVATRCSDSTGWQKVENVTNSNGKLTVVFTSLCPIAVLVDGGTGSHETGVNDYTVLFASLAGVFAVAAISVFAVSKKRKFQ